MGGAVKRDSKAVCEKYRIAITLPSVRQVRLSKTLDISGYETNYTR